jgi:hypothetical protein
MSLFGRLFKSHKPASSTTRSPSAGSSRPACMFQEASCTERATWRTSKGHYCCDEHKEVMDVGFRLNRIDPGWERL